MDIRTTNNVFIPMRDGVRLATDIYLPVSEEPVPTLLVRGPYGRASAVAGVDSRLLPSLMRLVESGYAVVWQDQRGTFESEGDFVLFEGDAQDGADTLDWIRNQPWSTGRVGMFGRSGIGFPQWQLAIAAAEGLDAIVPAFTAADHYRGGFHMSGGLIEHATGTAWSFGAATRANARRAGTAGTHADELALMHGVLADPAAFQDRLPLADRPELAEGAPWYTQWMAHDADDEYWRTRSPATDLARVQTPALIFAGWFDIFLDDSLQTFASMKQHAGSERARLGTRIVIGPWSHAELTGVFRDERFGPTADIAAIDFTGLHLAFYDRWLRDAPAGDGEDALPVRLFVMGANEWRSEPSWPLPDTEYKNCYLDSAGRANTAQGDGVLGAAAPMANAADRYLADPLRPVPTLGGQIYGSLADPTLAAGPVDQTPNEARDDVLCYTTEALQEPLEITGPIELKLFVSSSAPDTDFIAKLVDVHPDGRALLVTEGALRARFRDSRSESSPLTPGQITEVSIDLWGTSLVVRPGHRLRLEVTSTNYPRYDRNTQTGANHAHDGAEDVVAAVNTIHHGPTYPSRLVLPVIDR